MNPLEQTLDGWVVSVAYANQQLSFKLSERARGMSKEMEEFAMVVMRLAFGDTAWNRNSSTSDLVCQTVNLPFWKSFG